MSEGLSWVFVLEGLHVTCYMDTIPFQKTYMNDPKNSFFYYYLGLREANSVSMDLTEAFCQPQSQGVALVSKAHQLQKAVLANRDATYFRWDFDNNTQSVSYKLSQ